MRERLEMAISQNKDARSIKFKERTESLKASSAPGGQAPSRLSSSRSGQNLDPIYKREAFESNMIFIYEGYMSKGRPRGFGRYISGDDDLAFVGYFYFSYLYADVGNGMFFQKRK